MTSTVSVNGAEIAYRFDGPAGGRVVLMQQQPHVELGHVGLDRVLVTTEARPGRAGDYDFNDVLMRRSTDGGKTFGPIKKLVDHTTYGKGPVSNFVMIPDRDERPDRGGVPS